MGLKDVENCSWCLKTAPGRIFIHAGATIDRYALEDADDIIGQPLGKFPKGAIIGYVDVYGFAEHSDNIWACEGSGAEWKWLLRDAKLFKIPFPCKGRLDPLLCLRHSADNLLEIL